MNDSTLCKPRFGFCFRRSFDNFKILIIFFRTYCLFMVPEKVEVLFLIRNIQKTIRIRDPESLNLITATNTLSQAWGPNLN